MKKEYILLFVLLLLGYAYYSRHRVTADVEAPSSNTGTPIELLPAKNAPRAAPVVTGLTPAEHGQMMALGIRQTVLPAKNAESINVRIKKKMQWCMVGDLDFIRSQSIKADQDEWRISLEQEKPVASAELSLEDMMEGKPLPLAFPAKDGVYGLYLCKNVGRGSCLNQNLWNPSQRSAKRLPGVVVNAQILVRQQGRIMVLPTDNWSRGTIDQIKTVLRKQKQDPGRLDALYQTIGRLKPLAAQFDEQGLSLPLAFNDPKCLR